MNKKIYIIGKIPNKIDRFCINKFYRVQIQLIQQNLLSYMLIQLLHQQHQKQDVVLESLPLMQQQVQEQR